MAGYSLCSGSYPHIRVEDGQIFLWNPVIKKRLAMRPEERVRLTLTNYLLEKAGWPVSRISYEYPVKQPWSTTRADMLLYDAGFKPWMLVECKSEDVLLNDSAALQAAQYNLKIDAPYVMLTNGINDYFIHKGTIVDIPPELVPAVQSHESRKTPDNQPEVIPTLSADHPGEFLSYWTSRGFIHPDLSVANWLAMLTEFWYGGNFQVRYNEIPVPGYHLIAENTGLCIWRSVLYGWNRTGIVKWDLARNENISFLISGSRVWQDSAVMNFPEILTDATMISEWWIQTVKRLLSTQ